MSIPFLWAIGFGALRARGKTSALGVLWTLINPILYIAIYLLVFGLAFHRTGMALYLASLSIGIFVVQGISRSLTSSFQALRQTSGIASLIRFPKVVLGLKAAFTEFLAFLFSLPVIFVVLVSSGQEPTLRWLFLPLIILGHLLTLSSASMLFALLGERFHSTENLAPHISRVLLYTSGALVEISSLNVGLAELLFLTNPASGLIDVYRSVLLGSDLNRSSVVALLCWALLLLGVAIELGRRHKTVAEEFGGPQK